MPFRSLTSLGILTAVMWSSEEVRPTSRTWECLCTDILGLGSETLGPALRKQCVGPRPPSDLAWCSPFRSFRLLHDYDWIDVQSVERTVTRLVVRFSCAARLLMEIRVEGNTAKETADAAVVSALHNGYPCFGDVSASTAFCPTFDPSADTRSTPSRWLTFTAPGCRAYFVDSSYPTFLAPPIPTSPRHSAFPKTEPRLAASDKRAASSSTVDP